MEEEPQADLVHVVALGEGERLAHESTHPLAQAEVPALDVIGLAALFSDRHVLVLGDDLLVALPEVRVAVELAVVFGDALPQPAARALAAVAEDVGDDLAPLA